MPNDVVVLGIDDVTFDELKERWVFSRRTFAKALAGVSDDKPRAIVYDVEFAEQSDGRRGRQPAHPQHAQRRQRVLSATEVGKDGKTKIFGGEAAQKFAHATVGNGLLPEGSSGTLRRLPYEIDGLGRCLWRPSSVSRASRSIARGSRRERRLDRLLGPARARPLRLVLARGQAHFKPGTSATGSS